MLVKSRNLDWEGLGQKDPEDLPREVITVGGAGGGLVPGIPVKATEGQPGF